MEEGLISLAIRAISNAVCQLVLCGFCIQRELQ